MRTALDTLVDGYVKELQRALQGFPAGRKREILDEVTEHISQARAELESDSEAGIRTVLDRLGEPSDIAAAARERFGVRPTKAGVIEVVTIIAIVIPFIGWLVGGVLVWMSRVWTTRDKVLTTILAPGVWVLVLLTTVGVEGSGRASGIVRPGEKPPRAGPLESSWPEVLGVVVYISIFVVPIAISIYLAIRARMLSDAAATA